MSIVTKEATLTFAFKIPRDLHDEVDKVRKLAKQHGASYDPSPMLIKALRKDLAASMTALEKLKAENAKRS